MWPTQAEVKAAGPPQPEARIVSRGVRDVFTGNEQFNAIPVAGGALFDWDPDSTYIKEPPFFHIGLDLPPVMPIQGARVLAMMPDSTTTDHISPAGSIAPDSPAAKYLVSHGVERSEWNSYGSRRGNHEVMMRGTFANIRIKNRMLPSVEGGVTKHIPSGENFTIWDAAERYIQEGTPLIILAGKEYGSGSSRDWAAKGPQLQGVRAVIAESFERIHRQPRHGRAAAGVPAGRRRPGADRLRND